MRSAPAITSEASIRRSTTCSSRFHPLSISFQIQILDAEESVSGNAYLGSDLVQSVHQGTHLGFHSGSVFNGPVYLMTLRSVGGSIQFDRVVIDLTENDGPELFDNVSFNAIPESSSGLVVVAAVVWRSWPSYGLRW